MNNKLLIFARKCTVVLGIALCPVFAMGQQTDAVTLPFAFDGGRDDLVDGMNQNGLGADLTDGGPKLNFDNTGDYLIIRLPESAEVVAFDVAGKNFSGGTFDVDQSTDGITYTVTGDPIAVTYRSTTTIHRNINPGTRFVKFVYTNKYAGDVGIGAIRIYKREFTVSSIGWITFYTDEAFAMPEGARGIIVAENQTGDIVLTEKYNADHMTVPAGTPLMINAEEGTYKYQVSNSKVKAPSNYLHGNLLAGLIAEVPGDNKYYKLANDQQDGLGWYYGNSTGGTFSMKANRAYLALPSVVLRAPSLEYIEEDFDEVTAVENTEAADITKFFENGVLYIRKNGAVYTAMGQRVK